MIIDQKFVEVFQSMNTNYFIVNRARTHLIPEESVPENVTNAVNVASYIKIFLV